MATSSRRPLASRPLPFQLPTLSPLKSARTLSGPSKRARSPDPTADGTTLYAGVKRARGIAPSPAPATRDDERERKRAEREQQKAEFKEKYTRAFPTWKFYFDLDTVDPANASARTILEAKVQQLGGKIEDFFSNEITHLITNRPVPTSPFADKENIPKIRPPQAKPNSLLKSPIKLRGRATEEVGVEYDLVKKAVSFGQKVWSTTKLDSVLERCLGSSTSASTSSRSVTSLAVPTTATTHQRSLTRLLQSERLHGTSERDPTQKRHDFRYFSRSSCFVLVEDMRLELATIAAHEYPINKAREGNARSPWPVLHCHPHARGPFVPFDEKEKRRWEKTQRAERDKEDEQEKRTKNTRAEALKRKTEEHLHAKKTGDLRRSVSMNNLRRRVSHPDTGFHDTHMADLDADGCDNPDSANASGYLASGTGGGYMAASGNSVGITSTTGTTSTAGSSMRSLQLPAALRGRIQQQVVTSRKFSSAAVDKDQGNTKAGAMGPPVGIPERSKILRKSRSTNTLKLPKREEGNKPGYCESCRVKFDDFKYHVRGQKHGKFAADDANFLQLDYVLARVKRRTIEEMESEQMERETRRRDYCNNIDSEGEEEGSLEIFIPESSQEAMKQDEWDGEMEMDDDGYEDLDH